MAMYFPRCCSAETMLTHLLTKLKSFPFAASCNDKLSLREIPGNQLWKRGARAGAGGRLGAYGQVVVRGSGVGGDRRVLRRQHHHLGCLRRACRLELLDKLLRC